MRVLIAIALTLAAWSTSLAQTFFWTFETNVPEIYPAGFDSTPQYDLNAVRTTEQAYAGSYSLRVGATQTFMSATFDNASDVQAWAPIERGSIRARFRYTGSKPTASMLFQITGKDRDNPGSAIDTDDSVQLLLTSGTTFTARYYWNDGFNNTIATGSVTTSPDTWIEAVLRWDTAAANKLGFLINGTEVNTTSAIGATACAQWHHLLLGNDTPSVPAGLWLDNVEVFDHWITKATGFTAAGPAIGNVGVASQNFTVTFTGGNAWGDQTITLNDGGDGGTFTTSTGASGVGPLAITPATTAAGFTFTYTPASAGNKSIAFTNSQGWGNPSSITFASAPPGTVGAVNRSGIGR